jgi:UDP-N-acetylmuramate dehydrogenase
MTTYKVGGPAEFFLEAKDKIDLREAFEWAKENQKEIFVLGGGSNLLISDEGIKGLVIKINNNQIVVRGERLDCGAGANLNRAMLLASGSGLSGLEWAAGIPGATIGGVIRGNAGAFGQGTADILENVEIFNLNKGVFEILSNKDCDFAYRSSAFAKSKFYIIWQAILKLKKEKPEIIKERIAKNLEYRRVKQPNLPSAGSIFKNIIFSSLVEKNPELAIKAKSVGLGMDGQVASGWIIDQAGLKGKRIGQAKVSLEHANFIVNTGNASAEDIWKLINFVKNSIKINFNLELETEIQCLGF